MTQLSHSQLGTNVSHTREQSRVFHISPGSCGAGVLQGALFPSQPRTLGRRLSSVLKASRMV